MKKELNYVDRCHRIGRMTVLAAFIGTVLFPFALIVLLKVPADWAVIAAACASILLLQIPGAFSQFVSYAPVVGPSAMYMMVVTGNFSNMKIPAVIAAKEAIGMDQADQGEESDIISTIAMASSTITCEVILIIGALLMSSLTGLLNNPVLKPAFDNVSPAVFGALFMVLAVKSPKLTVVPMISAFLLMTFTSLNSGIIMPLCVVISVVAGVAMYKAGWLTPKDKKAPAPKEG